MGGKERKTVCVVAAVIHQDGKIFATQRGYGDMQGGWEFPGGKQEPGESPEEALKREIMEELNTSIAVEKLLDTVEYDYPTFHLRMTCYWCRVVSGSLELLEHQAACWLRAEELKEIDWLPADRLLLPKIERSLNQ